jgi:hypothetical protein
MSKKNQWLKLSIPIIGLLLMVALFQISFSLAAPGWYAGDNHDHTTFSDGAQTPTQMATTAKGLGLGYFTITDHNTIAGKTEIEAQSTATFIGICGDELTRISPNGHANAYNIVNHIDHTLSPQAMIDATRANNNRRGFLFINHPCWSPWQWDDWSVTGYTGLEVWNAYYVGNWNESYNKAAFDKWDELNRAGRHLYGLANTDAHNQAELGYGYNMTYATDFTRDEILNALRTGRSYGTNGPQLALTINGLMMGSDVEVPAGGGTVNINLSASFGASNISTVKLIKNNSATPINTWSPLNTSWSTTLNNVAAQPGDFFRMTVECTDTTKFAFSNPIFVKSQGTAVFTEDFNAHAPGTTPDGWTADSSFSIVTDGTSRYQVDAAAADKYSSADTARANSYVQAKCKLVQLKTGSNYFGIAARYTDAANNYLFYYDSTETRWKIGRYLSGAWLKMASGPAFAVNTGVEYTLKFEVDGERLSGYVNGALQCSTSDPALTSGKIACYGNNAQVTFDDIAVYQFSGTPVPTPTPAPVPAVSLSPQSPADSNQTINVTISNAENPSHATDWIGLYEANVTPNGNPASIWWDYLPNLGITTGSGTFTFNPANIPSAQRSRYSNGNNYKFILAYDDSYVIQASTSFTVGNGGTATPTPTPGGPTPTPTPTATPGANGVAWWKFNETSGTTAADSWGSNTGTLNGPSWVAGKYGNALSFDGKNDVVNINKTDIATPWTAAMWVNRTDSTAAASALIGSAGSSLRLEQYSGTNKAGYTKSGVADYVFNYTAPTGTWVHLTFVGTSSGVCLYVNGVFQESNSGGIDCPMGYIGKSAGGDYLKGKLDEVKIYNRALSAGEIAALAQ